MQLPERIETPRLLLRKPRLEDAADIHRNYAADPEVTRFLTWRAHDSQEESVEVLEARIAHWERGTNFSWCLFPREAGAPVIGMISTAPDDDDAARWSIGYVLGRPWWNAGYMTEAVQAVVAMLLAQSCVESVWAYVDMDNPPSARVLAKAGLQVEERAQHWSVCPAIGPEARPCRMFSRSR